MACCAQALSAAQQQAGDEDSYEYNSLLRHGIFEAYSGILNGMSKPKSTQHLTQVAPVRHPSALGHHDSVHTCLSPLWCPLYAGYATASAWPGQECSEAKHTSCPRACEPETAALHEAPLQTVC